MTVHAPNAPTSGKKQTEMTPAPIGFSARGFEEEALDQMMDSASTAASFLKALGHEGRMMILCYLSSGEKSVTELEQLLSARQAAVSQQLARLRAEGLIAPRREGKTIYYSLSDKRAERMMQLVYELFCSQKK